MATTTPNPQASDFQLGPTERPRDTIPGLSHSWTQVQRCSYGRFSPDVVERKQEECFDFQPNSMRVLREQFPPPSIEIALRMLRNTDRIAVADRVEHLNELCQEDGFTILNERSLASLTHFCLSISKDSEIPNLSVSPNGSFVADRIRSGEAMAMEFVGSNLIRLATILGDQAETRLVTFQEAEAFLVGSPR